MMMMMNGHSRIHLHNVVVTTTSAITRRA